MIPMNRKQLHEEDAKRVALWAKWMQSKQTTAEFFHVKPEKYRMAASC